MSQLYQHLVLGYKSLLRAPIFVLTIALTVGLTSGALGSVFGLSYLLMAEPLPYKQHEQLYLSSHARIKDGKQIGIGFQSYPGLVEVYKSGDTFEQAALIQVNRKKIDAGLARQSNSAPSVGTTFVTPEYFSLFSAEFERGSGFGADSGINSYSPAAVISYDFWREMLDSREDIVGHTLLIDDISFKIVGVLAREFIEPKFDKTQKDTALWLPMDFNVHDKAFRQDWTNFLPFNYLVGKIDPTQDPDLINKRVNSKLKTRFEQETQGNRYWSQMQLAHHMVSLEKAIIGESQRTAGFIFLGLLGIFLLALGNVTNLFVSRSIENHRAFSIRAALGASKAQLFVSVLCEALVLVMVSFIIALIALDAGNQLIIDFGGQLFPRLNEFGIDSPTVMFLLATLLLVATVFAWFTVKNLKYSSLISAIQGSGKGTGQQVAGKTINPIVIVQVTFAGLVLAASIEVALRAMDNIQRPLGFDVVSTQFITLESQSGSLAGTALRNKVLEVEAALENHRKVAVSSLANSTPLRAYLRRSVTVIDANEQTRTFLINTDADYFDVTSIPLLAGRAISEDEFNNKTKVAVLSEALKHDLFGDEPAVGKTIVFGSRALPYLVVGVAKNTGHPSPVYDKKVLYLPETRVGRQILLRTHSGMQMSSEEIAAIVKSVDPRLSVFRTTQLQSTLDALTGNDFKLLTVALLLVLVSAAMTIVGIYGAMTYAIRLMKYELGVRMAIGAAPWQVIAIIVKNNVRTLGWGVLFSLLIGSGVFALLSMNLAIVESMSFWSPVLAITVIGFAAAMSASLPVYQQLRALPITYLRD